MYIEFTFLRKVSVYTLFQYFINKNLNLFLDSWDFSPPPPTKKKKKIENRQVSYFFMSIRIICPVLGFRIVDSVDTDLFFCQFKNG